MMNPDNQAFNLVCFLQQIEEILKWKQTDENRIMHFRTLSGAYVATLPADVIREFHRWEEKLKVANRIANPEES